MNLTRLAIPALVVLVVSIVSFWLGRRRGSRVGYASGYAAMQAVHEAYRNEKKAILEGLQKASSLPTLPALHALTLVLVKVDAALAWLAGEPTPQEAATARKILDGPVIQEVRAAFNLPRSNESRAADIFKAPNDGSAFLATYPRPHSHEPPK